MNLSTAIGLETWGQGEGDMFLLGLCVHTPAYTQQHTAVSAAVVLPPAQLLCTSYASDCHTQVQINKWKQGRTSAILACIKFKL